MNALKAMFQSQKTARQSKSTRLRSTFSFYTNSIPRSQVVVGAAVIALDAILYAFYRAMFDVSLVFVGLCSISIGLLELRREKGSLRGKAERG